MDGIDGPVVGFGMENGRVEASLKFIPSKQSRREEPLLWGKYTSVLIWNASAGTLCKAGDRKVLNEWSLRSVKVEWTVKESELGSGYHWCLSWAWKLI